MTAHEFDTNLSKLTGKLKKEDRQYATIVKAVQIFYWIYIPVFIVRTIRYYTDSHNINNIISGVALILGFLVIALSFRKYYKDYRHVDYSLPTLEMLKKAASRYQACSKKGDVDYSGPYIDGYRFNFRMDRCRQISALFPGYLFRSDTVWSDNWFCVVVFQIQTLAR